MFKFKNAGVRVDYKVLSKHEASLATKSSCYTMQIEGVLTTNDFSVQNNVTSSSAVLVRASDGKGGVNV